ncbi:j domain-containing protein [Caerostris extrusa]|uniref:J domain-containing protein n=1 Tax=Caerostris extrusa TaxID=172846 RepID=A0AAV4MTT9_CAEEX|nr:j domain-containing protein [Caerostris extrusa]
MIRSINKSKFYRYCNSTFLIINYVRLRQFFIQTIRYKSHYSALGLDSTASPKDIKSAYYKLSMKFHPDKNSGCPEATEKFKEITQAYEVLGNPEKKKTYDQETISKGFYDYDYRRNNFTQRPNHYTAPPRTGRTKYYNYDEHYRQHYEEYIRRREAENEYFRRRWEADQRARYGDDFEYYKYRPRTRAPFNLYAIFQSKTFVYLLTFWFLMFIASLTVDDKDRDMKSKVLYYNAKKDAEKKDVDE